MRWLRPCGGKRMAQRSQAPRLMYAIGLSLSLASCGGCRVGGPPPPTSGGDLVSSPGVSAPIVHRVQQDLDSQRIAGGRTAQVAQVRPLPLLATTDKPFDCQSYAKTLIPWQGTDFTSPIFRAASEATLPDSDEFAERRSKACAVLQAYKAASQ